MATSLPGARKSTRILDSSPGSSASSPLGGRKSTARPPNRRSTMNKKIVAHAEMDSSAKAEGGWGVVQKAVNATRFFRRLKPPKAESSLEQLGTLSVFINFNNYGSLDAVLKTNPQDEGVAKPKKQSAMGATSEPESVVAKPSIPQVVMRPSRQHCKLTAVRARSARNQQLRQLLPQQTTATEAGMDMEDGLPHFAPPPVFKHVGLRASSLEVPTATFRVYEVVSRLERLMDEDGHDQHCIGSGVLGSSSFRATIPQELLPRTAEPPKSNFTLAFVTSEPAGLHSKPRMEQHPLLALMGSMQEDDGARREAQAEHSVLAHRLEELRFKEKRSGDWVTPPEKRKVLADGDPMIPRRIAVDSRSGRRRVKPGDSSSAHTGHGLDMQRIVDFVDPEGHGFVSCDSFLPLMFWLGLARHRSAAHLAMELAFGPGGMIDTSSLLLLGKYVDVQLRLAEGLRRLCLRESLDQLCEYITDLSRIRLWYASMKRDHTDHVETVEVQNLLTRMELTSDRQALFRFLGHVQRAKTFNPEACTAFGLGVQQHRQPNSGPISINDFASLLCRSIFTWCLHKTMQLIQPAPISGASDLGSREVGCSDGLNWVQLQRKIMISLLVNHRFWGREARSVLQTLKQTSVILGTELSPEQWLCLFQRVLAQGLASTLPQGHACDDPTFLERRAQHSVVDY